MEKSQLRQKILLKRSKVHTNALLKAIHAHLKTYLSESNYRSIGLYWPIRNEIDLTPMIELLPDDFQWYLPSVQGGEMNFYPFAKGDILVKDETGVPGPNTGVSVVPDLLLVPCLAMDADGYRLGYGQGWYDRYLTTHPTVFTLGVVAQAFFVESLPRQTHDRALNAVVTEKSIRLF